jgi:hypothetical protein
MQLDHLESPMYVVRVRKSSIIFLFPIILFHRPQREREREIKRDQSSMKRFSGEEERRGIPPSHRNSQNSHLESKKQQGREEKRRTLLTSPPLDPPMIPPFFLPPGLTFLPLLPPP